MTDYEPRSIAVVDDEESIRELLTYALEKEGFEVSPYSDGREAWDSFSVALPDLAILDILMPRMDGLQLCRKIRSISESMPLIFLTSKDEEFDRVLGLELGGDDYLCKPFSTRELIARIRVLFRRISRTEQTHASSTIVLGPLVLDTSRHEARWGDKPLKLTVTEFRLIIALVNQPGVVLTRDNLLQAGYPYDEYISDRNIDSHIKRIRRKLQAVDEKFDEIEAVYGVGYRYRDPR